MLPAEHSCLPPSASSCSFWRKSGVGAELQPGFVWSQPPASSWELAPHGSEMGLILELESSEAFKYVFATSAAFLSIKMQIPSSCTKGEPLHNLQDHSLIQGETGGSLRGDRQNPLQVTASSATGREAVLLFAYYTKFGT